MLYWIFMLRLSVDQKWNLKPTTDFTFGTMDTNTVKKGSPKIRELNLSDEIRWKLKVVGLKRVYWDGGSQQNVVRVSGNY